MYENVCVWKEEARRSKNEWKNENKDKFIFEKVKVIAKQIEKKWFNVIKLDWTIRLKRVNKKENVKKKKEKKVKLKHNCELSKELIELKKSENKRKVSMKKVSEINKDE